MQNAFDYNKLTEEQKEKFEKLNKFAKKEGRNLGFKYGVLLIFSTLVILVVDVLVANNSLWFAGIAGFINGWFLSKGFKQDLNFINEKIKEEIKNIFE